MLLAVLCQQDVVQLWLVAASMILLVSKSVKLFA
jgi:hypothetical protein